MNSSNLLEILLTMCALGGIFYGYRSRKLLDEAHKEHEKTLDYTLEKLRKARYDADSEYKKTGWAPISDKPDTTL